MEAKPILYQRRLVFDSQDAFLGWVASSTSSNLRRVRVLTIGLTDIDLSPLSHQHQNHAGKDLNAWSLYQRELNRLDEALRALPNVAELTIRPPAASHSRLLRSLYLSFLSLIPCHYSRLKRLVVEDDEQTIARVPSLNQLRTVIALPRARTSNAKPGESMKPRRASVLLRDMISKQSRVASGNGL